MKRNDIKQLLSKSVLDLAQEADRLRVDLARMTVESRMGKQKNVRLRFMKRKDLARILTILRMKQLQEKAL